MGAKKYDIIVIGAGSGGLGSSGFAAKIGMKTLLIEKADHHIGGDCLNYGCVPSKALLHVAEQFQKGKNAAAFGGQFSGKADIAKVMDYVRQKQDIIREHENAAYLRTWGMDIELGLGKFVSEDTVEVNGKQFTAPKIVLATGSRPRHIPIKGIEQVKVYDNESLFGMTQLPERLLVIGGGPIACEMGQAFQRFGAQVTMVNLGLRLLERELPEMSEILQERFTNEGVTIHNRHTVKEFTDAHTAIIEHADTKETLTISLDAVLMAVGRVRNIESLDLDKAGIAYERDRIQVNRYLRTTNRRVYAVGDVAGFHQFSHAAEMHVRLLANNLLSPLKKKLDSRHLSWVTFTDPQVATFGYSEQELKDKNISYRRLETTFADDDKAVTAGYRWGKLVLYVSKKSLFSWKEKILGGSMIAPNSGELIQELILANMTGMSTNAIFDKVYPYPTASRINQKMFIDEKEKLLTPGLKKLLQFLFRL